MNRLAYLILALVVIAPAAHTQVTSASSTQVKDVRFNDRTMNILVDLAQKYRVVIGVSGILVGSDSRTIQVALQNGALKDVLDSIVRQDPRFEWHETEGGSIHVIVRASPLELLNVNVARFEVAEPQRTELVEELSRLPEVADWLQAHRCSMDEIYAGSPPKAWKNFSVHVDGRALSSVFDEIALQSGTYFWSVLQYNTQPCAINARP